MSEYSWQIFFFSWDMVKFFTLAIIALMVLAMPFNMKGVERTLPATLAPIYRKHAADTYVQTAIFLLPIFLAAYNGFKSNNLTGAITLAFLSICFFGGVLSLWNARKSWLEIETAKRASANFIRLEKVSNIKSMIKILAFASLFSAIVGLAGLIYVSSTKAQPSWFWFFAFLMTMYPISIRPWSNSILVVASKYANDPKFGEEGQSK